MVRASAAQNPAVSTTRANSGRRSRRAACSTSRYNTASGASGMPPALSSTNAERVWIRFR
jgi:hypothetical protein